MLAKCLNPVCSTTFRYMREGRLFHVDFVSVPTAGLAADQKGEYFWLCAECARRLKVVVEDGQVTTRPMTVEPLVISFPKPPVSDLSISTARRVRQR
jgi:hypothetical protein